VIAKFKSLAAPVVALDRSEQLVGLIRDGDWGFGAGASLISPLLSPR
jgi:hypothetical protein